MTPGFNPKQPKDLPVSGAVEEAEVVVTAIQHHKKEGKLKKHRNFLNLNYTHRPQANLM
jgi:hypothetical protein